MSSKKFIAITEPIECPYVRANEVGIVTSESGLLFVVAFVSVAAPITLQQNDCIVFDPKTTGDAFDKKVCNVCHRLLDTTFFDKNQNGKNNRPIRRPSCNECRKIIDGVDIPHKERIRLSKTKPEYEIFQCPICLKKTIPGLTSKVVLDHDHTNGKVRGWICDSCNTGIGRFKDDIALLESAIAFLKTI